MAATLRAKHVAIVHRSPASILRCSNQHMKLVPNKPSLGPDHKTKRERCLAEIGIHMPRTAFIFQLWSVGTTKITTQSQVSVLSEFCARKFSNNSSTLRSLPSSGGWEKAMFCKFQRLFIRLFSHSKKQVDAKVHKS